MEIDKHFDSFGGAPRTTRKQAFQAGVRAAEGATMAPSIPYGRPELADKFVEGFKSVRPWPYKYKT